jgi:hypothetical protein
VSTATIRIEKCIQDIQNVSSNPDESAMCSQIYFEMEVDEKVHKALTVEISQPYGSDYANEPVEVGRPEGYEGPFNHIIAAWLAAVALEFHLVVAGTSA